ncbi:4-methyl-5(b-hydroxyethyl)-thiazole monophosphate biosynthesis [Williamsoniiplasma luminosum]|uniref:4-methyl-5(B-hydroxyethyl)-thiazole monophosphate biosynthesis n=1 Tax=Williamsoniiplasma luminosum TaxID=214888 RepID=A0A2K8NU54_9MOLU|nr:DJ-1 family glyoxalase III [Williamsoniiplasma luminosum]ATZ17372.1 4-methyl-5(b-hydroxyethyl)-thiazole monophosphate biosynthesis [Williamsoniiplasma luminosum]
MIKLAILLHDGLEETEAIATIDILRRAKITVEMVAVHDLLIKGSHQINFMAEKTLDQIQIDDYDGLIIPGGGVVEHLLTKANIIDLIKTFYQKDKVIAAICAAPQLLGKAGIVDHKKITHFPTCDNFLDHAKIDLTRPAITDGKIITGQSIGTVIPFALEIVKYFLGETAKMQLESEMVVNYS